MSLSFFLHQYFVDCSINLFICQFISKQMPKLLQYFFQIMKKTIFITVFVLLLFMKTSHSLCPQLCEACNGNSCTACYSSFEDNSNVYLASSCPCPTGYFYQSIQGVCNFCPIYCTTCTNYTTCTSCISGYEINNKKMCVRSVQNANHWITNQISYDLSNTQLSKSLVSGFLFVNATSSASINSYFTYCQGMLFQQFFGLYSFGYNTELFKSYYGLPYHQWAQIIFQFIAADNWNNTALILEINGVDSYTLNAMENVSQQFSKYYTSSSKTINFCLSSYPDNLGIMDASFSHIQSMLKIRIKTSLDGVSPSPGNANYTFFGIRQVLMRIGTCPRFCNSCNGPSSCTSCQKPTYLAANGSCVCNNTISYTTSYGCLQFCRDGFIYLSSLQLCSLCSNFIPNCHSCASKYQCNLCQEGFYLNQGLCVSECPSNYQSTKSQVTGTNNTYWTCTMCPTNCSSCQNSLCQNCSAGYLYQEGQCIPNCSIGYYVDSINSQCLPCPQNCLTCSSSSNCLRCVQNNTFVLLNGKCVVQCPATLCQTTNCSSNCLSCYADKCYSCQSPFLYQNFACVTSCTSGFFQVQSQCRKCISPCLTCKNDLICLTCVSGYVNYFGKCLRNCPNSYFINSANTCQACVLNCLSCVNALTCLTCQATLTLLNGTCYNSINCGINKFYDSRFGSCESCPQNCTSCYQDLCYSCIATLVLDNGQCQQICSSQKIIVYKNISINNVLTQIEVCQWKDPLCKTYTLVNSTIYACVECIYMVPALILVENADGSKQCSFVCPLSKVKVVVNQTVICSNCQQHCLKCDINQNCLLCDTMHVLNPLYNPTTNQTQCAQTCPSGYTSDGFQCASCVKYCDVCQLDGKCLTCKSGYALLPSNVCALNNTCNGYQYYNQSTSACTNCSLYGGCNTCTTKYYCSSCGIVSGVTQFLQGYFCVNTCDSGYFAHMSSMQCRPCSKACTACSGFEDCTTCISNYYLLANPLQFIYGKTVGVCVQNCPSGYYNYNPINPNVNISSCQFCSSNCLTCYGSLPYQCLTCYGTFKLDHSTCLQFCPPNKYPDQFGHCDWCDPSCLQCSGPSQFQCITCRNSSYLYRGQCWTPCPAATFAANYDNRICEDCQWGCAVCSSPYFCYLCFGGFYLYQGWCYSQCPYNTHPIRSGLGMACDVCQNSWAGCNKCSNDGCLSCEGQLYLYTAGIWNSTLGAYQYCVSSCPTGYFKSLTSLKQCQACPNSCVSCVSLSECTSCVSSYILDGNKLCTQNCPLQTFYNGNSCQYCPMNCRICTNSTTCNQCELGYYMYSNTTATNQICQTTCPSGYYADPSGVCNKCYSNCIACISLFNCTNCSAGTTLSNGVCVYNVVPNCNDTNCAKCLSSTTCQYCMIPYYLYLNTSNLTTCVANCPNGYYKIGRNCQMCNYTCVSCDQNLNNCSSCISGLFLFQNKCYNFCPVGYFADATTSTCKQCSQGCYKCSSLDQCFACTAGYYYYLNKCYNNCPISTYPSGLSCINCGPYCQTCMQQSVCTICQDGFYLLNNSCIYTCPTNYYLSILTYACESCSYPCSICLSDTVCTTCESGFVLNNNVCQNNCSTGLYPVSNTDGSQYCKTCPQQCLSCLSSDFCTSCIVGYSFIDGNCTQSCPITTYSLSGLCVRCSQYCLECTQYQCTSCHNSTILYNNTCVTFCPSGTFRTVGVSYATNKKSSLAVNTCNNCSSLCLTCNGSSAYNCLSCSVSFYLNGTTCLSVCPTSFYASAIDQTCKKCMYRCLTCTNSSQCQQCNTSFTLTSTYACNNTIVCTTSQCQICSTSNNCSQCLTPYYLLANPNGNNTCVLTCPSTTYANNQFNCVSCPSSCLTCTISNCLSCSSNYYLYQGTCQLNCPSGFQAQNLTGICIPSPCLYTNSNGSCVQCLSPYLLQLDHCVTTCSQGYYTGVVECIVCSTGCQKCINSQTCISCQQHYIYTNSKCVQTCPDGYYDDQVDSDTPYCRQCNIDNCLMCSNSSVCTQCQYPTFLVNNSCVYNCPVLYYYMNQQEQICQPCESNCMECSNSTNCYICANQTILFNGDCLTNCPNTYYLLTTSQLTIANTTTAYSQCLPCMTGCQNCVNSYSCNYCASGYNLYQSTTNSSICILICPSGTYNTIYLTCAPCPTNCLTCDNINCFSCTAGTSLYNGKCISVCPTGYFSLNSQCFPCSSSCNTCSGSSINCLTCQGQLVLDANANCVQNCTSISQFYNQATMQCQNCSNDCLSCYGSSYDQCTSCKSPLVLYQHACVLNCPSGSYPSSSSSCDSCDQTQCQTCDSVTDCTSCHSPLVLIVQYNIGRCATSCAINMFYNSDSKICQNCQTNCINCQSSQQCVTCSANYVLYMGDCISNCPYGYTAVTYQGTSSCQTCLQGCQSCTFSSNNFSCTQCYQGLYLYQGNCYLNCPANSFVNLSNQCQTCVSPCNTCASLTNCTTCITSYYFLNGNCYAVCPTNYVPINRICVYQQICSGYLVNQTCLSNCPYGTYPIIVNSIKTCLPCSSFCLSCVSSTNCVYCASGTFLLTVNTSANSIVSQNTSTCVLSCPLTAYSDNGQCINCLSPCNQCTLNSGQTLCITCIAGYYLFNGNCLLSCPSGYYQSASSLTCVQCQPSCLTCNSSGCVLCSNSLYTAPACTGNCTTSQYWSSSSSSCVSCYTTCATCYGGLSTQCITCKNVSGVVYYLYGSQCVSVCPNGYYSSASVCYQCTVANCQACINNSAIVNCSLCSTGYVLAYSSVTNLSICTKTCLELNNSTSTFIMINNQCVSCQTINGCSTCSNTSNNNLYCTQCQSSQFLYSGICYSVCPSGTFSSGQTCVNCSTNCATCSNSSGCTLCKIGYFLFNNNCVQTCPTRTYGANQQCTNCSSGCSACNSTQCITCQPPYAMNANHACTLCQSGYYLNSGLCLICNSNCLECSMSSTNCTTCPSLTYILSNVCYTLCPISYQGILISNILSCQLCSSITQNCTTCSNNQCTSCISPLYQYLNLTTNSLTCVQNCPAGTFLDSSTQSCKQCSSIFSNCSLCSSQYCTQCITGQYILSNVCYAICPMGYYANSSILSCQMCDTGCKSCSSLTNCLTCQNNLANNWNGTCSQKPSNCTSGYYLNAFNSCSQCDSSCVTCSGSLNTNCLTCLTPQFSLMGDGSCKPACNSGSFYDSATNLCKLCSTIFSNCTTCNSTNCLSCSSGILSSGQCISGCANGTYLYNQQCVNCPQYCATCNSSQYCTNCSSPATIYYNNLCYTVCPFGSYSAGNNTCAMCVSPCLTCNTSTNCSSCVSSYYYYNYACVTTCPNTTYTSGNNCMSCPTNCSTCTSSMCTNCSTSFVLYNGACNSSCPTGYYANTSRICIICPTGCSQCVSATNCQSCISGYVFSAVNNSCQNSCGDGKFMYFNTTSNLSSCVNCLVSGCKQCNSTTCFKCNSALYSIIQSSLITNCTTTCPAQYFRNTSSMSCINCLLNCNQCTSQTNCTLCNTKFVLLNGSQCFSTCPIKYFSVTINGVPQCQSCSSSCNYCTNSTVCTQCASPMVLLNLQCASACPTGYYLNPSLNKCLNCTVPSCGNCSQLTCYQCKSSYFGIVSISTQQIVNCTTTCPLGSYANSTTQKCYNCLTNCISCSNSTKCQTCQNGTALYSGSIPDQCVSQCPASYFWNGTNPASCLPCGSNCLSCQNSTMCNICVTGYLIYYINSNQNCVQNCPDYYYSQNVSPVPAFCSSCETNCISCMNSTSCIACGDTSAYTLINQSCIPNNCINCQNCDQTVNPPICLYCTNPYFLYHGKCLDYCPDYHYENISLTYYKCSKCIDNCLICLNNNSCVQCITDYVYTQQTGCILQAILIYGNLANMSSFTSNITQTVATVYLSSSAGPMVFGEMSSTYFNIQFTQFLFFHDSATGGNQQMSTFLQSLQVMSLTSGGASTPNTTDSTEPPARRRRRLQSQYTSSFIQVNAPIFAMMFGFLGVYLFIVAFQKYLQESCRSNCSRVFLYVDQICTFMKKRFKWIYFDFIMWISYLPFLYFSLLQLKNFSFADFSQGFSSLLAVVIIVTYPLYPVFIIYLLKKDYFKLAYDTDLYREGPPNTLTQMSLRPYVQKVKRPIHVIDDDLVEEEHLPQIKYFTMQNFRLIYNPLKYFRKFIFVLIVVAVPDPITLISILVTLNIIFIIYMFALRPRIMPYLAFDLVIQFVLLFFEIFLLTYLLLNGATISIMSIITHGIGFLTANLSLVIAIVLNLVAYYKIFQCIKDLIIHLKTKVDEVQKKEALQQKQDMQEKDLKNQTSSLSGKEGGQLNLNDKQLDNGRRKKINDDSLTEEDDQSIRLSSNGKQLARDLDQKQLVFNGIDPVQYAKQFSNIEDDDMPNLKLSQGKIKDRKKGSVVNQISSEQSQMGNSKISYDDDQLYLVKDINKKKKQEDKYKKNNTKTKVQDAIIVEQPADKFKKYRRSKNHEKQVNFFDQSDEIFDLSPMQDSEVNLNINTNGRFREQQVLEDVKFTSGNKKGGQNSNNNGINYIDTYDKNSGKKVSNIAQAKVYQKVKNGRQFDLSKLENEIQDSSTKDRKNIRKGQKQSNELQNNSGKNRNQKDGQDVITFDRTKNNKKISKEGQNQNDPTYKQRENNKVTNNKQAPKNAFDDFDELVSTNQQGENIGTIDRNSKNKKINQKQQQQWENIDQVDLKNKPKVQKKNKYYKKSDEQNQAEDIATNDINTKNIQNKKPDNYNNKKSNQEQQIQELATKNRNPLIKNKFFKGSDDQIQEIGQIKTKEATGNKYKRKQRHSQKTQNKDKNLEEGKFTDNQGKRKERKDENNSKNQNDVDQGQTIDFKGKKKQKIFKFNQNSDDNGDNLEDGNFKQIKGTYLNNEGNKNIKNKKQEQKANNQLDQGRTYDHRGNKVQKSLNLNKQQSENPLQSINTQKSITFKKGSNFVNNNDFEEENYDKRKSSQSKKITSARDNGLNVNEGFQQSYEEVVRKNKQKLRVPQKKQQSGTFNINQADDFEQSNYIRPQSKIQRPSSKNNKDRGLGINQQNNFSDSEDVSKQIRKQRSSAHQRIHKKSNLNIEDKSSEIQDMQPQDQRRSTIIKKKKQLKSGILQIQDFSEDENIQSIQL